MYLRMIEGRIMKYSFSLFALFLLLSCSSEGNDGTLFPEDETYLEIYSDSLCTKAVTETDTLDSQIDSTLKLYVESSAEKPLVIYDKRNIVVECVEQGLYLCTPISRGTKSIIFIGNGNEQKNVNFKVKGISEVYYVTENSYTIDTSASEDIKNMILHKLSKRSPQEGNLLEMFYEELKSGIYSYWPSGTTGTFILSDTADYVFAGEDLMINFTLQSTETAQQYFFVQDLTDTFKLQYPQVSIDKVLMTSSVERWRHSHY